jgi:hypothetical protein
MAIVTWNPIGKGSNNTLSNNNLTVYGVSSNWSESSCKATKGVSTGKYYWEIKTDTAGLGSVGVSDESFLNSTATFLAENTCSYLWTGQISFRSTTVTNVSAYINGDIIGVALNLVDNEISFYKNNVFQYKITNIRSKMTGNIYPTDSFANGGKHTANFGGTSFSYEPPTGYIALQTMSKYLIKQNSNYYNINSANYDSITSHNFMPLTLTGGTTPNKNDIETFGFTDLNVLTNNVTFGSDNFIPLSKFGNQFDIKMYKPN